MWEGMRPLRKSERRTGLSFYFTTLSFHSVNAVESNCPEEGASLFFRAKYLSKRSLASRSNGRTLARSDNASPDVDLNADVHHMSAGR